MKSLFSLSVLIVIFCVFLISASHADTLIYNNSTTSGYFWPMNSDNNEEFLDYGSSSGGLVSKFKIGYATSLSNPGVLYIKFWQDTSRYSLGTPIKTITITDLEGSPNGNAYAFYREYVIPEEDRFELPAGNFGYSYEFSWSYNESGPLLASGGLSNQNYYWLYFVNKWYDSQQINGDYAGFYMKVYTGPALADITCDITGNKFDDADGDGVWDAGEPGLAGWEIYADTNNNDQFDPGVDPNVVTDPNGMYFFENLDAPATYTIREVAQDGWTQTLPGAGGGYEYVINAEPNTVYGPYDFGNTTQVIPTDIILYGYVETVDGTPISNVRVETDPGSTSSAFDDTDGQGYYEITVSAPFTGSVSITKTGWQQNTWSVSHTDLMTDYQQDFQMLYLYGGGDGSENNPFQIYTPEQMNFIGRQSDHWDKHFILMANIDLSGYTGTQFNIIGNSSIPFTGIFDGYGYSLSNFSYDATDENFIGLFGVIDSPASEIKNLGLTNSNVQCDGFGSRLLGSLAGKIDQGTITNCYAENCNASTLYHTTGGLVGYSKGAIINCYSSGTVSGNSGVGGLVGQLNDGTISGCDSDVTVSGSENVGGLVGDLFSGIISGCSSEPTVSGEYNVGGLVGRVVTGEVLESYSIGSVSGTSDVGGLAGYLTSNGTINRCYSECDVSAIDGENAGGLVGEISYATASNSYARGSVFGRNAAGLVGKNYCGGTISNCYSIGFVSKDYVGGGLVASTGGCLSPSPQCIDSFWDTETSGWGLSRQGIDKTTAEMVQQATFTNWDFDTVWRICDGMNYPRLQWEPKPVGDFVCPEGVEVADLMVLCNEWLAEAALSPSADMAPDGGDGMVDMLDFNRLAQAWLSISGQPAWDQACDLYPDEADIINELDLMVLSEQWLLRNAHHADIAPVGAPDGKVDGLDYSVFAENWLTGTD